MLTFTAVVIAACAGTRPIGERRNDGFSGKLDNILIIGVTSLSTRRRAFDDKFVETLAELGVSATPSCRLIDSSMYLSREIVEKAIEGWGMGDVLVTHLAAIKEQQVYRQSEDRDENLSYFTYSDKAFMQEAHGYYTGFAVLSLETKLYDTESGELVRSMQSEAIDASQPRSIVDEQIDLTIRTLAKRGLI
ncbi:MAG: hypothetical protein OEN02_03635 [Gammaproteobacteria bacterium]|nr:hypothetical protein [Gammaproteobacteria bacterium]MDH3534577.1 hypothetical protein [Gammaproteobacteria bacterium]